MANPIDMQTALLIEHFRRIAIDASVMAAQRNREGFLDKAEWWKQRAEKWSQCADAIFAQAILPKAEPIRRAQPLSRALSVGA
jgi:hypothetical protein